MSNPKKEIKKVKKPVKEKIKPKKEKKGKPHPLNWMELDLDIAG